MPKQHHSVYFTLLVFTVIVNLIVYLQFTKSIAHTSGNHAANKIDLLNGDLILRNSKGLLSSVFRNSSMHDRKFTHAGLLHKKNDEWFVYHFIDDKKNGGLYIESLDHFISDERCTAYAFYRYQLNSEEQYKLDSIISSPENQLVAFDSDFDLATDSSVYCSEWIAKTLTNTTCQKNFIPQTTVGTYSYIAPDNLYLNAHCKLLYQNEY